MVDINSDESASLLIASKIRPDLIEEGIDFNEYALDSTAYRSIEEMPKRSSAHHCPSPHLLNISRNQIK